MHMLLWVNDVCNAPNRYGVPALSYMVFSQTLRPRQELQNRANNSSRGTDGFALHHLFSTALTHPRCLWCDTLKMWQVVWTPAFKHVINISKIQFETVLKATSRALFRMPSKHRTLFSIIPIISLVFFLCQEIHWNLPEQWVGFPHLQLVRKECLYYPAESQGW